jgi:uncharacterized protein (TIGR02453 family)
VFDHFSPAMTDFLRQLAANNNREWFDAHRQDYEQQVREPALAFIAAMETDIRTLSPYYEAVAKKVGGSLMRIHRDTRFGHDKRPYKTNVGIQFRHESGKDIHAPGFYLHIEPGEVFAGVGVWHPEPVSLGKIRDAIAEHPARYQDAILNAEFASRYELSGERLIRPPRGYSKDHPLIEEIKRKDFIGIARLDESELFQPGLCDKISALFASGSPLQAWLCDALGLRY